jgi:hypothetical protein
MTNNNNPSTPETGAIQTGADGIQRRTIIAGAAWTIPVVATAVGAPLAAASPAPTLTFTNGPYTVAACGTLKDVIIQATTDGTTPDPGQQVTVTLPSGLTWSDGTTTPRVFIADGNGNVTLSGIKATSAAGSPTITATSNAGPTATAVVTVAPSGGAYQYNQSGTATSLVPNVPVQSTPVGGGYYLAPDGNLYDNTGALVDTGVSTAIGNYDSQSGKFVSYLKNGVAFQANGTTPTQISVPAGSNPVGGGFWLASNGTLYFNDGTVVTTGVSSAVGAYTAAAGSYVGFVKGGVTYQYNAGNGSAGIPAGAAAIPNVPANSTLVGGGYYLAPNGDLYDNNGAKIASNVTSAQGSYDTQAGQFVGYESNGIAYQYNSNGGTSGVQIPNVPAGSTPLAGGFYLSQNGDLYNNTGTVIATKVLKAAGGFTSVTGQFVGFTQSAC